MSILEQQLKLSVELSRCSPELRRYVQELRIALRQAGMKRLLADIKLDEDSVSMFHKPQIGPVS